MTVTHLSTKKDNIMKFKLRLTLAVLASLMINNFQSSANSLNDASFLWQTKINGATVYLGGTIHCAKKECYPLPEHFMRAYEASDCLIMEISDPFDEVRDLIILK